MKVNQINRNIILYSLIAIIIAIVGGPSWHQWDTDSYLEAGKVFFNGDLDDFRTPGYSCFLYLFEILFGKYYFIGVILIQSVLFLISVHYFNLLAKYFIKNERIRLMIVLLYACHPATIVWQKMLMTESFSLSIFVLYIYIFLYFVIEKKNSYCFFSQLILLFLLSLRPSFIYILPLSFIFLVYLFIKQRSKIFVISLGYSLVLIGLFFGYNYLFQKRHGVFASSIVGDINQYWMLRETHLIDYNSINNINLKNDLLRFEDKGVPARFHHIMEFIELKNKYGFSACHEVVKKSLSKNWGKYVKSRKNAIWKESVYTVGSWEERRDMITRIGFFISPNFFHLYTFFIIYMICFFFFLRGKNLFWSIFLWTFSVSGTFVVMAGSPNCWSRLIVPNIPVFILMFGQILEIIFLIFQKKIYKKYENTLSYK